jgi:hypothetical protein
VENISVKFWNFLTKADKWKVILFVFTGTFILRLPTVFIDYIHIDVITSYIIAQRDIAGLLFKPNKGPVYHSLVKWSIKLFGDSPASFHLTGIIFVLLTILFIYLLGKRIYGVRAGLLAALFYGFIISSFQTEFLATNGEIIYNLFFISSFYFFYLLIFEKKMIYLLPLLISLLLGIYTKFQGSFAIFALLIYLIFAKPSFIIEKRAKIVTYYIFLGALSIIAIIFIIVDWNYTTVVFKGFLRQKLTPMVNYVANRGFSPFHIIGKLLWRSFQFTLYHSIIWIPGIITMVKFFRNREHREDSEAYLIVITLFLFLTIFLGGARLSPHYFIPLLPTLAILSAKEVLSKIDILRFKRIFFRILILPVLFFFIWNIKDVYIGNFKPDWKHNESRCTFFFRILVIGSHGEYLLPHKSLLPVLKYLDEKTGKDETIFVWPMGSEVVYYSKRRSATHQFWFNERALHGIVQREKGNIDEFIKVEKSFIREVRESDPNYFIDVGSTSMIRKVLIYKKKDDPPYYFDINTAPMIRFGSFGGLDNFPGFVKFLNENFQYVGEFGKARLWKKPMRAKVR